MCEIVTMRRWAGEQLDTFIAEAPEYRSDTDLLGTEMSEWGRRLGVGYPDAGSDVSIAHYVSRPLRHAPAQIVRLVGDFTTFLTMLDDLGDQELWPPEYYESLIRVLRDDTRPPEPGPFHQAAADLRGRVASVDAGSELLPELVEEFRRYCAASAEERRWLNDKTAPPIEAYLINREARMFTRMLLTLHCLQPGMPYDNDSLTPIIRLAFQTTVILCGLENDILSYHRDVRQGTLNIITILMGGRAETVREAFVAAVTLAEALYGRLNAIIATITGDPAAAGTSRRAAAVCHDRVTANHRFHMETPRYRSEDATAGGDPSRR